MIIGKQEWSTSDRKKPSELARTIARDLISCGDEPGDPCHRIAFIGGEYPDNEIEHGGLCEESLARHLDAYLKNEGV